MTGIEVRRMKRESRGDNMHSAELAPNLPLPLAMDYRPRYAQPFTLSEALALDVPVITEG